MLEYYSLQQQGKHTVLVAEYDENLAGYLIVRPRPRKALLPCRESQNLRISTS